MRKLWGDRRAQNLVAQLSVQLSDASNTLVLAMSGVFRLVRQHKPREPTGHVSPLCCSTLPTPANVQLPGWFPPWTADPRPATRPNRPCPPPVLPPVDELFVRNAGAKLRLETRLGHAAMRSHSGEVLLDFDNRLGGVARLALPISLVKVQIE